MTNSYDPDTREIEWEFGFNDTDIELGHVELTDTLDPSLTLVDYTGASSRLEIRNETTNTVLTETTDYTINYDTSANSFTIEFVNDVEHEHSIHTLQSWTKTQILMIRCTVESITLVY